MVVHQRERELTYDVDEDWAVPDLGPVVPEGGRVASATHELSATYYDTERSTLRLLGFTLRRREGGEDAGWHLKIPADEARTEVHSQASARAVPRALTRRIAGVVGADRIQPVATIRTTRHTSRVLTAEGDLVLEVADDRVVGMRAGGADAPVEWREVEVELGAAGSEDDLGRVAALLDGARPAVVQRKISHVLGEPAEPSHRGQARLVADYVREQCREVLVGDVRLRDEPSPESVHKTRVALRRLRSTLRTFPDAVLDVPQDFDGDLRWLATLLSPIRDADILERRLQHELDRIDPADVVGPVRQEVRNALWSSRDAALLAWRKGQDDERYRHVLATLVQWYASVPVPQDARLKPAKTLRSARRKVDKRLAAAKDPHALHQARKAAKRLRYAGDLLEPELPDAAAVATRAKHLQTTLGDHQDLAVAAQFLRERAVSGEVDNGFTYGVLVARLEEEAAAIRRSL